MPQRYAIYFTPQVNEALYQRVTAWLGHSIDRQACRHEQGAIPAQLEPCRPFARGAAMYGFHATLKPPFRLAEGCTEKQLQERLQQFAEKTRTIACSPLRLARLGGFLALLPEQKCDGLDELARNCVVEFDAFRAPSSAQEISRRNSNRLSPPQRQMLDRWGYPYVIDEFRFHMTLTDRLPDERLSDMQPLLHEYLSPCLGSPLTIDGISLCQQANEGLPFTLLSRFSLQG